MGCGSWLGLEERLNQRERRPEGAHPALQEFLGISLFFLKGEGKEERRRKEKREKKGEWKICKLKIGFAKNKNRFCQKYYFES